MKKPCALFLAVLLGFVVSAVAGADPVPEGLKGFRGMMVGTLVEKGDKTFVLKVEKVTKVWKQNKAAEPQSAVGKNLSMDFAKKTRLTEQHLRVFATLKAGDRVEVEPFHLEGNSLTVIEVLKKVD